MTEIEYIKSDEMSLQDVWRVLLTQKAWLFGVPSIFMFLAVIGVMIVKPKWEATAVIQIGQSGVGQVPQLIEPPVRTIERMKMKSFEDDVLTSLKLALEPGDLVAELFRSSFSQKALGTTELIQARVRGYSADQATTLAGAVVDQIKAVHEELILPTIDKLNKQLAELKKQMKMIQDERENLSKIVSTSAARSGYSNFSENLLLSNLLFQKNAEFRDFEMRRLVVEEQLTLIRKYPTTLVGRIDVPERPASPKKLLVVVLAAIIGLILGIIIAFLRNYWASTKSRT